MNGLNEQFRATWPMATCILIAFVVGFSVSLVSRKGTPPSEAKHIDPLLYFRHSMSRASTQARTSIVESQSKYLDVGFDVPSGGAFRVLDVIVTEAPRFSAGN